VKSIVVRGVTLFLHEHEAVCDAIRAARDFYEADVLDDVADILPAHRTIVDVGANLGNHSVYWASFVPHTGIVAIEPHRPSFALLRRNTGRFPTVRRIRAAASDRAGVARMEPDHVNYGRTRMDPAGSDRVPSLTLDSLGLTDVTLLKVDVEGHQADVLAGATSTLARCRPAVLIEDGEDTAAPVLRALGYACVREWRGANSLWTPA
jgi:FkbM family methyltransferase